VNCILAPSTDVFPGTVRILIRGRFNAISFQQRLRPYSADSSFVSGTIPIIDVALVPVLVMKGIRFIEKLFQTP
jgi:hypothetical protein